MDPEAGPIDWVIAPQREAASRRYFQAKDGENDDEDGSS